MSIEVIPHNVRVLCRWVEAGELDGDHFLSRVLDEVGFELGRAKVKLAKRVSKHVPHDWTEIQRATGADPAQCRQAVMDARFPPAGKAIRLRVLDRDRHRCVICGSKRHVVVDHIIPRSAGGRNTMQNLQALCSSCNTRKGSALPGDPLPKIGGRRPHDIFKARRAA